MNVLYEVIFIQPGDQINLNDRLHWRKKAELTALWRKAAWAAGLKALAASGLPPAERLTVATRLPVKTNHKRDPHNWFPTVKAIVDGLTDAKFWPDDNSDHVSTLEPTFGKQMHNAVIVRIGVGP